MAIQEYTPSGKRSDKEKIHIYYFEDAKGHRYEPSSKIIYKVEERAELKFYTRKDGERIELKAIYNIVS